MIYSTVSSLLEISRMPKVSRSNRARAIQFMRDLRHVGFSNHDIEVIIGGKWKEASIKRFTRGVKIMDTTQRDEILQTLSEYVSKGLTHENVHETLIINKLLATENLSLEYIIQFFSTLRQLPISLNELIDLQEKLKQTGIPVEEISDLYDTACKFHDIGINSEILEDIIIETRKYTDTTEFLQAFSAYNNIIELIEAQRKCEKIIQELQNEIRTLNIDANNLSSEYMIYQTYMEVAQSLLNVYKFDPISLKTLMEIVQKMGEPFQILDALNTYNSFEEVSQALLTATATYQGLNDENKKLRAQHETMNKFIEEAHRSIGEIKANQDRSLTLQNINEIMVKPTKAKIEPQEFLRISLLILTGMTSFATINRLALPTWESNVKPLLTRVLEQITKTI